MKKVLALLLVVATLFCVAACGGNDKEEGKTTTTTTEKPTPVRPDPTDSNNWDKVVNGVFTSAEGGLQMDAEGWKTYGLYNISFVPEAYENVGQTNAVCVKVYETDPEFATKTKESFEETLSIVLHEFSETTVYGYPAYKAVSTDAYYIWVINTPNHKYFISFMQAPLDNGGWDFRAEADAFMETVKIFK